MTARAKSQTIRFGTDGWRGIMAEDMTFANVRRVAAALAIRLERLGTARQGVAVGFDRRLLSAEFAAEADSAAADDAIIVGAYAMACAVVDLATDPTARDDVTALQRNRAAGATQVPAYAAVRTD